MVKNEGDKYSLAQIQADIYGQEIDDGFNKADGKRKSKKKSKKGKSLKQVNNPATNLYNEVNMTFEKFFFRESKSLGKFGNFEKLSENGHYFGLLQGITNEG